MRVEPINVGRLDPGSSSLARVGPRAATQRTASSNARARSAGSCSRPSCCRSGAARRRVARERSPSLEAVVQSPSRPVPSVARRRCASSQACSESASTLVVLLIHAVSRLDAMHSRPPVCLEGRVLNQPGRRTTVVPGRTTRTMSPWFSSPVPVWMVALCALAMPATNDRPMPLPRTGVLATR